MRLTAERKKKKKLNCRTPPVAIFSDIVRGKNCASERTNLISYESAVYSSNKITSKSQKEGNEKQGKSERRAKQIQVQRLWAKNKKRNAAVGRPHQTTLSQTFSFYVFN